MAEEDFRASHVAEDEIRAIITHLERQDQVMLHILARMNPSHRIVRRVHTGTAPTQSASGPNTEARVMQAESVL